MSPPTHRIAIIGAGLSGLTLALALHKQGIPSIIYESRGAPLNIGGAIMLSPNALRIFDNLGIYERIRTRGFSFELLEFRDAATDTLTETYEFGGERKYGYKGLRVYRHVLIDVLLDALKVAGVPVVFGKKFARVSGETGVFRAQGDGNVTWEFADGSWGSAEMLVGADGIHSKVREYLYPNLQPTWTGMAGITAAVPASNLRSSRSTALTTIPRPVTYTHPSAGAFVIAPQAADGSELLIGKQRRMERALSRAEWDEISADKEALVRFLQADNDAFPQVVHDAAADIPHANINVWPFYVVPRLDAWASEKRRVVVLGDAAHAIPPSAGQGVNQAVEDVYMLALLLAAGEGEAKSGTDGAMEKKSKKNGDGKDHANAGSAMKEALDFWQAYRQDRVDRVLQLNKRIDMRRLPTGAAAAAKGEVKTEGFELGWLYDTDLQEVVRQWLAVRDGDEQAGDVTPAKVKDCAGAKLLRKLGFEHE